MERLLPWYGLAAPLAACDVEDASAVVVVVGFRFANFRGDLAAPDADFVWAGEDEAMP